jgi:hypothetical protein
MASGPPVPRTGAEKIRLFRSLFRGRTDVFPKRWENAKQERSGYAPACANEWVRGVCEKPKVRCGECPNQAFIEVEDRVVADHLGGKYTAGIYPLLRDDTCWFVALDFDEASWTDDVAAFVETCHGHALAPAVERSRSGNGAHVWFFFTAPVPARDARDMASFLLTETMRLRRELKLESYDRLFPSQDTLPQGGFGNRDARGGDEGGAGATRSRNDGDDESVFASESRCSSSGSEAARWLGQHRSDWATAGRQSPFWYLST